MHLISRNINIKSDTVFTIRPLGDIHIGTVHCDKSHFMRDVRLIEEDPHCLWIGMGDYCESIVLSDPRFAPDEIAKEFQPNLGTLACAQRDSFVEATKPIADKCIGLLEGNHEYENRRRHYVDIVRDACRELGTEYLGDTCIARLTFRLMDGDKKLRASTLTIYAEHGSGGGRKTGSKINSLEDMMSAFEADIYLRGHVHQKLATKHPRLLVPSRGKVQLKAKTRICALTGCYYRTYETESTSYGERKSYPPTELGSIAIRYRPMTGEVEVVS